MTMEEAVGGQTKERKSMMSYSEQSRKIGRSLIPSIRNS
jgi:hypothetical protein